MANAANEYEVIIAGASYAGLTAARHLDRYSHRVLLLDEHAIGAVRHSACAVPTRTLADIGGLASSLQETEWGVIHTKLNAVRYRSPEPWTVFDHRAVCEALREQAPRVPFVRARITGFDGHAVTTDNGVFAARYFLDATGWRAALASVLRPTVVDRGRLTIGMEVTVPYHTDALHIYVDRGIVRWGYGWIFPCGNASRVGIGAFDNPKGVPDLLRAFLRRVGMSDDLRSVERAGGYLPWQQRPAALDNVLLLGDAAGHCLPLTGEGIRFAFQDGDAAGRLLDEMLSGGRTWASASASYRNSVERHRARVGTFTHLQRFVRHVPNAAFAPMAWLLARHAIRSRGLTRYMNWEHDAFPALP
ncbi:MAG: geranylgeranyl reductase family protein [Thermomicrobiales bacterium]